MCLQVPQRYTAFRTLHAALKALPEDQLPKASKASIPVPPPKTIGKKKDEVKQAVYKSIRAIERSENFNSSLNSLPSIAYSNGTRTYNVFFL